MDIDAQAEFLYQLYPRKVGKKAAIKAIKSALRDTDLDEILPALSAFADICRQAPAERRFYIPYPATWFNQGRWEDDLDEVRRQILREDGKRFQGLREFLEEDNDAT